MISRTRTSAKVFARTHTHTPFLSLATKDSFAKLFNQLKQLL